MNETKGEIWSKDGNSSKSHGSHPPYDNIPRMQMMLKPRNLDMYIMQQNASLRGSTIYPIPSPSSPHPLPLEPIE